MLELILDMGESISNFIVYINNVIKYGIIDLISIAMSIFLILNFWKTNKWWRGYFIFSTIILFFVGIIDYQYKDNLSLMFQSFVYFITIIIAERKKKCFQLGVNYD